MKNVKGKMYVDEKDGCYGHYYLRTRVMGKEEDFVSITSIENKYNVYMACLKIGDEIGKDGYVDTYDIVFDKTNGNTKVKNSGIRYGILK